MMRVIDRIIIMIIIVAFVSDNVNPDTQINEMKLNSTDYNVYQ